MQRPGEKNHEKAPHAAGLFRRTALLQRPGLTLYGFALDFDLDAAIRCQTHNQFLQGLLIADDTRNRLGLAHAQRLDLVACHSFLHPMSANRIGGTSDPGVGTDFSPVVTSLSIAALPSGLRTDLSKSNSALAASVIFCTLTAGGGGGAGGAGGGGATTAGGGAAGLATRSGSHSTMAIAG